MKLTDAQRVLLSTALQRDDGTLQLPAKLKGGAAQKLIAKLLTDGHVVEVPVRGSMPLWRKDDEGRGIALRITAAGLAAIQARDAGAGKRTPKTNPTGRGGNKRKIRAKPKQPAKRAKPRRNPTSGGPSKQDRVIALLSRRQGTTIAAIMKATGWQQHSVRGFLAGVVRKKLGLKLLSEMQRGVRTYRIAGPKRASRKAG